MSVLKIESFDDILKVHLTPNKTYPEGGYFYTDNNAITLNLLDSFTWFLAKEHNQKFLKGYASCQRSLRYHQEYAYYILGYYPSSIDHIDGFILNNCNKNLNVVSAQENQRNKRSKGYYYVDNDSAFHVRLTFNCKTYHIGYYNDELQAIQAACRAREFYYSDYDYNFLLDRRDDADIVDLEMTKQITADEAILRHVKRYALDNAWYVYRYNLFGYFQEHNLHIPTFEFDNLGYMIHPITGQRLCPFK